MIPDAIPGEPPVIKTAISKMNGIWKRKSRKIETVHNSWNRR